MNPKSKIQNLKSNFRPAWVEVDLGKIKDNVKNIKNTLKSSVGFMAVVKANGYGHGSVEVSNAALETGADCLGVALVEEAEVLRDAGISAPIHLLTSPPPGSAKKISELNLIPAVYTEDHLEELNNVKVNVHLKVDTGMNRIGLKPCDLDSFIKKLKSYPNIKAEGLFTHFATADDQESGLFKKQLDIFSSIYKKYKDYFKVIHAANSAAAIFCKECHFDMVRVGIAMYGLQPSHIKESPVRLKPALSWLARVSYVKRISKGDCVSYGAKYRACEETNAATVPVGYADGYPRNLSNKSFVIVKGKKMPQIGTICMDQFLFQCTDDLVEVNEKVILIGEENGVSFTADDVAMLLNTINYEVVCGISNRVARKYI